MRSINQTTTILDRLARTKRGPQVITPKDAAALVGLTGVSSGWRCLSAGSGNGWLDAFIGNLIRPTGRLTSYERDERWFAIAKENIKFCELNKIVTVKKGDIARAAELKKAESFDMVMLDMKEPDAIVAKAARALKEGGFLAVYSPHIEQQIAVVDAMRKSSFCRITTVETIQRPWHVGPGPFTHPEISGLLHTGFWTVGRKLANK